MDKARWTITIISSVNSIGGHRNGNDPTQPLSFLSFSWDRCRRILRSYITPSVSTAVVLLKLPISKMKASFARSVSPTAVVVLLLVVAPVATVRACEDLVVIPQEDLQAMLPPSPEWDASASAGFIVASDDPLVTPAEASGFNETATYEEVSEFYGKLAAGSDFVEVESLMTFPNGEDLWLVKVSGEMAFDKSANATNPIVYVTAGIHPGESSGVNAGMVRVEEMGKFYLSCHLDCGPIRLPRV